MIKLIKRLLGMQEEILEIEIICEDAEPLPLPEIIERHFDLADFEAWRDSLPAVVPGED